MKAAADTAPEPVRLLFEMTRDDNPRLYDDLVRFKKGVKRVNRLRFLAHEGLMAQQWGVLRGGVAAGVEVEGAARTGPSAPAAGTGPAPAIAAARHTNQVFDMPPGAGVGK